MWRGSRSITLRQAVVQQQNSARIVGKPLMCGRKNKASGYAPLRRTITGFLWRSLRTVFLVAQNPRVTRRDGQNTVRLLRMVLLGRLLPGTQYYFRWCDESLRRLRGVWSQILSDLVRIASYGACLVEKMFLRDIIIDKIWPNVFLPAFFNHF